ncbi:MAG: tetratricopeptide repeat protein [Propionivibrio sp.]|nr:tetratricopeptide repeat protein [Propionivibrio sp.]MBP7524046.1 tetratricopeptide repeat protein [Propionivibrio sp.]MBP8162448.1 tetratricopeptide repeat protein [Propionivibrio sp.]
MSLINQMLRDLDERRAAHGVGANLPSDVRPLPKARKSYWPVSLAVGAGVVIVLGIAGVFLRDDVSRHLAPVVATVTQANAPAAPVAVAAVPATAVIEPQPEPVAEIDMSKRVDGVDVSLRMADFIEASEEADGVDKAETESETDKRESSAAPVEAKSTVVQPAKPPVASAMTATPLPDKPVAKVADKTDLDEGEKSSGRIGSTPVIERTPAAGSPHERAESEYRKAIAAVNQGRVSEAVDSLRNALHQDSLHVASRQLLVRLLLEAGNKDEAIRMLRDGIAGQPAQLGWAMSLARLQVDRGELDSAWQTLDHTLPAAGNNPDYLGFAANVLQRLGRHGEAADQYRKATRIAPADGRWWLGLGWCLDAQGQAAEAREAFLHARQSGNLSPELLALIDQKLR